MGVVEIKQNIEKLNESVVEQQAALSSLREQIISAVKPFAKERIKAEVESQVKHKPDHTKSLGKDVLSEMKNRLTDLLENCDAVVDAVFSDDSLWVHVDYRIKPDGDRYGQGYNNKKSAKENIYKGIKIIIGEAGKILIDNQYLSPGHEYQWDKGMRYDYTRGNAGASKLMYGYGLSLPQDIDKLIGNYIDHIEQLHTISCQLVDLQKALSQQEAVDLWNEV